MKRLLLTAVVSTLGLVAISSANAAGGCGPGWHPGPYGHHCFRNGGPGPGPAVVVGPGVVGAPAIGVFVRGRGYWDGHRWWGHREWRGGVWRYR